MVYPISSGRPDRRERVAAQKATREIRQWKNDLTAAERFKRILATNFTPRDVIATLTYSDEALPATAEIANKKKLKPFIRRLRSEYGELGELFKYAYVTEGYHGDRRLHHHIVLPKIAELEEIVKRLWSKNGEIQDFRPIGRKGYRGWAMYLTKEPRKTGRQYVGQRMWTPSLNLQKPEVTTYEMPDGYEYEPPPGVVILDNRSLDWEWFKGQYISYFVPDYLGKN